MLIPKSTHQSPLIIKKKKKNSSGVRIPRGNKRRLVVGCPIFFFFGGGGDCVPGVALNASHTGTTIHGPTALTIALILVSTYSHDSKQTQTIPPHEHGLHTYKL